MSASRLLALYTLASPAELSSGLTWYARARAESERLAKSLNVPFPSFVGVIACLSPQQSWETNIQSAQRLIENVQSWRERSVMNVIHYSVVAITRKRVIPITVARRGVAGYGRNVRKALALISPMAIIGNSNTCYPDSLTILSGEKVRAFYRAIVGITQEPVIDGHAYGAWLGSDAPVNQLKLDSRLKLFDRVRQDYINAAGVVGVTPCQFQAVVWLVRKRTRPTARK